MLNTGPKRLPDVRPRIGVGRPGDDSVTYFGFSKNRAHRFCHVFNRWVVFDFDSPTQNPIAGVIFSIFSEFTGGGWIEEGGLVFFLRRRISVFQYFSDFPLAAGPCRDAANNTRIRLGTPRSVHEHANGIHVWLSRVPSRLTALDIRHAQRLLVCTYSVGCFVRI